MRRCFAVLVLATGCGSVSSQPDAAVATDAPPADATAIDTPTGPCNLSAPFGTAAVVAGASNVPSAAISPNERVLYYDGPNLTPHRASRNSPTEAFSAGAPAPGLPNSVFAPSTPPSELVVLVHSGQGKFLIGARPSTSDNFGSLTDTGVSGSHGFAGASAYYFGTGGDLYRSTLQGTTLGQPARLDSLVTAESEGQPVISGDDLEIAFLRGTTLVVARRDNAGMPFGNATELDVGTTGTATPAGFSQDRCRLYVTAAVGNSTGLFVAARP